MWHGRHGRILHSSVDGCWSRQRPYSLERVKDGNSRPVEVFKDLLRLIKHNSHMNEDDEDDLLRAMKAQHAECLLQVVYESDLI
mmetsp:Transcript_17769/g.35488  ORF Transcript_17769/g.35488 Transcript_17769/m.35488 type:complete len:84 (+) Transcript_17769:208-459(+)